ncbi:MAG: sulfite exporter TauE/SafE family protein [Promethearchaeota archaeon]
MGPLDFLVLVLLAVGIGFLASLFGIGGGFLLVPTMILMFGLSTHMTVGTVAFVIIFMSLSSVAAYARQKRIDYVVTLIVAGASIFGAILGALATQLVTGQFILVMFGLVEATLAVILGAKKTPQEKLVALEMNRAAAEREAPVGDRPRTTPELDVPPDKRVEMDPPVQAVPPATLDPPASPDTTRGGKKWYHLSRVKMDAMGNNYTYRANLLLSVPLSFIAGFLSSMLGIGGGTLYIQIFVFLCGMPIHMAIASSIFVIFLSHISAGITFAAIGRVDFLLAVGYIIGMVIGAQAGAYMSKKINAPILKKLAALIIVVIAARMIYFALVENPGAD